MGGGVVLRMQPRKLQCWIRETQSNRVSDFRDFVSSLFPKATLFDFYFKEIEYISKWFYSDSNDNMRAFNFNQYS